MKSPQEILANQLYRFVTETPGAIIACGDDPDGRCCVVLEADGVPEDTICGVAPTIPEALDRALGEYSLWISMHHTEPKIETAAPCECDDCDAATLPPPAPPVGGEEQ